MLTPLGEWVIDCLLMPNEQMFSYIMARTSYIRWDDNNLCFVLDQTCLNSIILVLANWMLMTMLIFVV